MSNGNEIHNPGEGDLHNILNERSSLKTTATATHQGCHGFTTPIKLGAKVPNHLATYNTVESERGLLKGQACGKRQETLHEGDSRAKNHRTQQLLCRLGTTLSHRFQSDRPRRDDGLRVNW
jgi:hypothetical protein